jgi:hypothetical protein
LDICCTTNGAESEIIPQNWEPEMISLLFAYISL